MNGDNNNNNNDENVNNNEVDGTNDTNKKEKLGNIVNQDLMTYFQRTCKRNDLVDLYRRKFQPS